MMIDVPDGRSVIGVVASGRPSPAVKVGCVTNAVVGCPSAPVVTTGNTTGVVEAAVVMTLLVPDTVVLESTLPLPGTALPLPATVDVP